METKFVEHIKSAWRGNLGITDLVNSADQLQAAGQLELVAVLYQTWLARNNTQLNHLVYFNLGVTLSTLNNPDAAKDAYRKAIELSPSFVLPHFNLGNIYERLGQLDAAVHEWSWILDNTSTAKPDERSWRLLALNNLGRVLENARNYARAYEHLSESLRIEPDQPDVIHHWVFLRARQCMWPVYTPEAGIEIDLMRKSTSALAMIALSDDPATQLSTATNFAAKKLNYNVPELSDSRSYGHAKIRVAYLSSDFCVHPVGMLTAELFELHDRQDFEIYGFCWTKEDNSALRQRIVQSMDHFHKIGDLSDEAAAKLIREHEIDIVVDLHGQTLGARPGVLAYRPAPIQITYLGLPATTGLPSIDYAIVDRFLVPEEFAHYYSEKPIYMPDIYQVSDRKRVVAAVPAREACGLPDDGFVFCSFNNNYKYTPEMFTVWMNILRRAPGSVLWLLADNTWAESNMRKEAAARGIDCDRLIFASRVAPEAYYARYGTADLFLDTFPFNAGTTANDALWMGLPVLTCSGRTFASRMAGALLTAAGLPELITYDFTAYEEKAVELAKSPQKCRRLRENLRQVRENGVLFDTARFTRNLEAHFARLVGALASPEVDPAATFQVQIKSEADTQGVGLDPEMSCIESCAVSSSSPFSHALRETPALPQTSRGMRPFFTIIIPTHRRAQLLERSIDSLRAQTFHDFEIILVSDCIDRETSRVADSKLSDSDAFIKRKGLPGPAGSRNYGLDIASGDYVILLDDDDTLAPAYLETLYPECEKNREAVLYGNVQVVYEDRDSFPATFISDESVSLSSIPLSQLYVKNFIPTNVLAYPRMALLKKRFDLHLKRNEDWDFLLNIAQDAEFKYMDICGARIHKDDPSKQNRRAGQNQSFLIVDFLYIYRKWPGRTQEIKQQRQQLINAVGLQWPLEWL